MKTQWWRRGVEKSWSSSSRSLQKVSGIFEVRFLPWHGTISFFLHVCQCHVLLLRLVLSGVSARLGFLSDMTSFALSIHDNNNNGKKQQLKTKSKP